MRWTRPAGKCILALLAWGALHMKRLILVVFLLLLPVRDLWACTSIDPTCVNRRSPKADQILPANAPALVVRAPVHAPGNPPLTEVTWTAPNGAVLPTEVKEESFHSLLVLPQGPLVPGVHTLTWTGSGCPQYETQHSLALTFAPVAARPTQTGSLTVEQGQGTIKAPTWSGQCEVDTKAAWARLHLTLDAAALPWLPVTAARVTVDGELWHGGFYGGIDADGTVHPWVGVIERDPLLVYAACAPAPQFGDPGVAQGAHTLGVQLHIAGMAVGPAPATAQVTLTCAAGPAADAGDVSAADAGSVAGQQLPLSRAPGCQADARGAGSPGLLALVLWMLAALRWRSTGRRAGRIFLALLLALPACAVNPVPTPAAAGTKASADASAADFASDNTASKFACTEADPPSAWDHFVCGYCGSHSVFGLVACSNGSLVCRDQDPADTAGPQVIDVDEWQNHTGVCAFMAHSFIPGFLLSSPSALETNRDPTRPLTLRAKIVAMEVPPTFDALFKDPIAGAAAIHALVTLTDMQSGQPVDYAVGLPQSSTTTYVQTLNLTPAPLASGGWYRVTVKPGDAQSFVPQVTFDPFGVLKTPQLTDFYTSSRPMLARANVVSKAKGNVAGYVEFEFTEDLVAADLPSQVTVLADGVPVSGCTVNLQPCQGIPINLALLKYVQLMLTTMPVGFKTLELRLPAAARSVHGGTLGDGAKGNPYATVVGTDVVYLLQASEMTVEDQGITQVWRFAAK